MIPRPFYEYSKLKFDLREHAAKSLLDQKICLLITRRRTLIDNDQFVSVIIINQAGCRINRKPDTSDNPKYTMRCFLIRLGMVGAEFKAARKVILRHLSGNSAFRKVGDTDAVSE